LTELRSSSVSSVPNLFCHKHVSLKVLVFVWQLFYNRLAIKDDLIRCGIINNDSWLCVSGCGDPKTASYLFLDSHCFGYVWYLVRNWLGIFGVDLADTSYHFIKFDDIASGSKVRRSIMQLIYLFCAWEIWKLRNNKIFNNEECPTA